MKNKPSPFLIAFALAALCFPLNGQETANKVDASFPSVVSIQEDWHWTDYYGYFNTKHWPWIWHLQHGWHYISPTGNGKAWLWDEELGWLWSDPEHKYYFWHSEMGWLYYLENSQNPEYYYIYDERRWMSIGEKKIENIPSTEDIDSLLTGISETRFSFLPANSNFTLSGNNIEEIDNAITQIDVNRERIDEIQSDLENYDDSDFYDARPQALAEVENTIDYLLETISDIWQSNDLTAQDIADAETALSKAIRETQILRNLVDEYYTKTRDSYRIANQNRNLVALIEYAAKAEADNRHLLINTLQEAIAEIQLQSTTSAQTAHDRTLSAAAQYWFSALSGSAINALNKLKEDAEDGARQWEIIANHCDVVVNLLGHPLKFQPHISYAEAVAENQLSYYLDALYALEEKVERLQEARAQVITLQSPDNFGGITLTEITGSILPEWESFDHEDTHEWVYEGDLSEPQVAYTSPSEITTELIELTQSNQNRFTRIQDTLNKDSGNTLLEIQGKWQEASSIALSGAYNCNTLITLAIEAEDMFHTLSNEIIDYNNGNLRITTEEDIAFAGDFEPGSTIQVTTPTHDFSYTIPHEASSLEIYSDREIDIAELRVINFDNIILDSLNIKTAPPSGNLTVVASPIPELDTSIVTTPISLNFSNEEILKKNENENELNFNIEMSAATNNFDSTPLRFTAAPVILNINNVTGSINSISTLFDPSSDAYYTSIIDDPAIVILGKPLTVSTDSTTPITPISNYSGIILSSANTAASAPNSSAIVFSQNSNVTLTFGSQTTVTQTTLQETHVIDPEIFDVEEEDLPEWLLQYIQDLATNTESEE